MGSNNLSYEATVGNLEDFFINTSGNSVTPEEIYKACGRDLNETAKNKSWLSNKTHAMGTHELFEKKYDKRGFHEFNLLVLTEKGVKALGRSTEPSAQSQLPFSPPQPPKSRQPVSLQAIADMVDEFNRQNPSWEIEVTPKRIKREEVPATK